VIDAEFDLPLSNNAFLRLLATHLDVYDETEETRTKQMDKLISISKDRLSKNPGELQIILGDFNALRRSDYTGERWRFLEQHDSRRRVHSLGC
jgi:endonuclease/exonuclease/phosphatase family metal-dependent hydrolase